MKNNTLVTIGIALLVLAVAWGTMRATVAGNSREIIILQAEADRRMQVLQGIDKNQARITEQLVGLARRVGKLEKE